MHVRRPLIAAVAAGLALAVVAAGCSNSEQGGSAPADRSNPTTRSTGRSPAAVKAPLRARGEWLIDSQGRVVQLRGVNEVYKSAPFYPAADGFGADDASFLASQGFNVVRLGVDLRGLMPMPGKVSQQYLSGLERTVDDLQAHDVFVLLDFHQDGFAPKYNGNGFPDWMAIDDGLENPPDAVFPLYYMQNPAMQRAWESFWQNRKGPDGVGIEDAFMQGVRATAKRFASTPNVIGYEALNEPWPGKEFGPCVTAQGCADLERELLGPFSKKFHAAVRAESADQLVWVEPFVTFNYGKAQTTLPGTHDDTMLAAHDYALNPKGDEDVVGLMAEARTRDHKPVLLTEFGAVQDRRTLERLVGLYDQHMLPWVFWAYNENLIVDRDGPASLALAKDRQAFEALVRPFPTAVAGTPKGFGFDPATKAFHLDFATSRAGGGGFAPATVTEVFVPELQYPDGYTAEVTGGTVTSKPCARTLTVRAQRGAARVAVRVTPPAAGAHPCPAS